MVLLPRKSLTFFLLIYLFETKPIYEEDDNSNNEICNGNTFECSLLKFKNEQEATLRKLPTHKELCKFCDITLPIVRYLIAKNDTEHFTEIISYVCEELKLADKLVCEMVVKTYQVLIKKHFILQYCYALFK